MWATAQGAIYVRAHKRPQKQKKNKKNKKKLKTKQASFLDYRSFLCQVSGVGAGAPRCHVNLLLRVKQVVCVRRGKGEGGGGGDQFATAEVGKGEGGKG